MEVMMDKIKKQRLCWFVLALIGAVLLVRSIVSLATESGDAYSISLNSAATFPVDI